MQCRIWMQCTITEHDVRTKCSGEFLSLAQPGPQPPSWALTVEWSRIRFKCFQEPVIQNGTDTNSTSCACMTGYQYDQTSGDCIDIDECELGTHKCVDNICYNLGMFSHSNIDYTICGWIKIWKQKFKMDPTAAKRLSMSSGRLMGQDHIKPIEARLSYRL